MQTSTELTVTTERNNSEAVISIDGRVTIDTSPDLRRRLLTILEGETVNRLTINLANVPYIDCSGLATLVEALRLARQRHTELELSGMHDRVLYLLQVTGLLGLFQQLRHDRIASAKVRA
jgi:anti-sigma B factor antagonist